MLHLMIVEDNKWTREGLAKAFDWNSVGITLKYVCSGGREAFDKLQNGPVDIIITDIRMDEMDGLELVRLTKQKYLSIEVILISAYEDFKYAQEAMNNGVCAYIVKPIDNHELMEKVKICVQKINREKASVAQSREYLKGSFIKEFRDFLLNNTGEKPASGSGPLAAQMKLMGVAPKSEFMVFIVECLPGGAGRMVARDNICAAGDEFSAFVHSSLCIGLYIMDGPTAFYSFRKKVLHAMESLNGNYRICAGSVASSCPEIQKSYQNAVSLLNRCFLKDITGLEYYRRDEENIRRYAAIIPDAEDLAEMVRERRDFCKSIEMLKENWIAFGTPREEVESYCRRYLTLLDRTAVDYGISMQQIYDECGDEQNVYSGSVGDVLSYLKRVSCALTDGISKKKVKSVRPVVVKALEYVHANYDEKSINLAFVSEKLALNYSYLSKCFKEDVGVNFTDYLNTYRIDIAKRHLRNSDMKIYEICDLVGIDSRYFNHLFKEYMGISPLEYKNSRSAQKKNTYSNFI